MNTRFVLKLVECKLNIVRMLQEQVRFIQNIDGNFKIALLATMLCVKFLSICRMNLNLVLEHHKIRKAYFLAIETQFKWSQTCIYSMHMAQTSNDRH